MSALIDLTGKTFGRLTVLGRADDYISPSGNKIVQWLCKCSCEENNTIVVSGSKLKNGWTKSCGCLRKEITHKAKKKYNAYDLSNAYGIGYTSNGEEFYFDLEDYSKIKDYCWHKDKDGYMCTNVYKNGTHAGIKMHRLIMDCQNLEIDVDHKYGEQSRCDNRKSNLRLVTTSQNMQNHKLRSDNTSGITGVSFNKRNNKWEARIGINNKTIHLGYFDNFDDAVTTRKEAEEKYFGEFSYDNSRKVV